MAKFFITACVAAAVATFGGVLAQEKAPPKVGALPPTAIDKAFEKATTEKQLNEALLNDPTYQKAVREALKAKKEVEDLKRKNPQMVGPSPAQAARTAFLRVLSGESEVVGEKK
jgi:hypothetical protein